MKKALSFILALVTCLSLIPLTMTASAYGNQYIQLEKSNFDPGESIVVTLSGITQQIADGQAWVGVYLASDQRHPNEAECPWYEPFDQTGTMQFTCDRVMPNGEYEMRICYYDWDNSVRKWLTSVPFTIGKVAKEGSISLNKTAYTAFEEIKVSVSGITEQMVTSKAFVGIYKKGAKHDEYGLWDYVKQGSSTLNLTAYNQNGEFEMRLYTFRDILNDDTFVMSIPFTISGAMKTSGWAQDLNIAEKAAEYGLIPDSLKGADWTKPITRAEFAAVSVKLYENLSGTKAVAAATNPFTDTKDAEVLKAYNTGLMVGVSADKFDPKTILNREQAATALTRVLKRTYIPGWTFATDGNYTLNFKQPAKFTDDAKISDWAKPSVYFMVANNIIAGVGNNTFAPKNTTAAEEALGYANATCEQALKIAVYMVENLKDKPLDFQQGAANDPQQLVAPEKPQTPPSSGNVGTGLVGYWRHYYRVLYTGSGGASTYMNKYANYSFYENGTFRYTSLTMHALVVEGKYSVSEGEIHFSDLNIYQINNNAARTIEKKTPVNTFFSAKYKLETDENGEYLVIGVTDFNTNRTFDDFSSEDAEKQKSRKQTIDYANLDPYDKLNHAEPVIMP